MTRHSVRARATKGDCGEVLLLGCEGSGKTLLLRQIARQCSRERKDEQFSTATQPSVGVDIVSIKLGGRSYSLREVGGTMQPVWPKYFEACRGVIFVADASSMQQLSGAVVEWYNLVCAEHLRGKPLILVLNTHDAALPVSETMVEHLFRFCDAQAIMGELITKVQVNAATGVGLTSLLTWLDRSLPVLDP
mmetsp:Transcript_43922/g.91662  ORF Transcript_43922/g.91662 Transcript_43922/m.91662 type:complete len:191 (+) Transcript_43922:284-856(+)|eukprot:6195993-Pleurochrysis_carterae.AAC.3